MDSLSRFKKGLILAAIVIALCVACFLIGRWKGHNQGAVLPSSPVPEHAANTKAPVMAKDKQVLRERKIIPKEIAADPTKEVTATGTKKDDTGTTHVSSVLDTETGQSVIIQQRPSAELFHSHEIGLGYTVGTLGSGPVLRYRGTVGRLWGIYGEVEAEGWYWKWGPRLDQGNSYDGQVSVFATYRFP